MLFMFFFWGWGGGGVRVQDTKEICMTLSALGMMVQCHA